MDSISVLQKWWQELNKTAPLNPSIVFPVLFLSFLYLLKHIKSKKLNLPPSPPKLPLIGNLHQIGKFPYRSLKALSDKYGPLMLLHFGSTPTLVISSGELANEISKNHDVVFADRPKPSAGEVMFYGWTSLSFAPYGEYWRQVKKVCVLEVLSQRRVQQFDYVREEETAKLVEKLRLSCSKGASVDLSDMLVTVSNNVISRSALGRVYENEYSNESFGDMVRKAIDFFGSFNFKDIFPALGFMDDLTGFNRNLKKAAKNLHDFLDKVIEEHQVPKTDDSKKDIVDMLLEVQNERKLDIEFTRENLKAVLMDMFLGGTDTTATTMDWTMAELMKNPTVLKKAQEEVRRVVGEGKSKVEEADLDKLNYLKCIVKETLRYRVSGIIPRATTCSTKLLGYDIPAKTRVLINAWGIQRDPKLWDRPDEYIPERFLDNSYDLRGQNKEYIPFGAGRRLCPGISYALREVEYVLSNLLYLFDWKLGNGETPESLDMSEEFFLVNRKKNPLIVVPSLQYQSA